MSTLYVGGLSPDADAEFIRDLFDRFASVESVRLVRREPDGPHRGFAYVTFADAHEAAKAAKTLDGESGLRVAPAP